MAGGGGGGRRNIRKRAKESSSDDDDEEESAVVRSSGPTKKAILTFSTGRGTKEKSKEGDKDKKAAVLEGLQIASTREAEPVKFAGDATAQVQLESTTDRTGNKFTGIGPVKAPSHIRSTIRIDYQPDICKDYRDTGFCGYGDSCKFMHDRGDYKAGWQIEREWDEEQKRKQAALARGETLDSDESGGEYVIESDGDDLPFACFICREPFETPVETQCKHYFCQACALDRYRKDSKCAACGKQTYGVFNVATKLNDMIARRKRQDAEKALEAAKAAADDDSGDDGQ